MRAELPAVLALALLAACQLPPDAADGTGPAHDASVHGQPSDAVGAERCVPAPDVPSGSRAASGLPTARSPAASASRPHRPGRSSALRTPTPGLVKAVVEEQPPEVLAAVESALALVRRGQLGIGLAALEAVHAGHPDAAGPALATVLHQQALNQYGRGELRAAERLWVRVLSVDADHPTARLFCQVVRDELGTLDGRHAAGLATPGR